MPKLNHVLSDPDDAMPMMRPPTTAAVVAGGGGATAIMVINIHHGDKFGGQVTLKWALTTTSNVHCQNFKIAAIPALLE